MLLKASEVYRNLVIPRVEPLFFIVPPPYHTMCGDKTTNSTTNNRKYI